VAIYSYKVTTRNGIIQQGFIEAGDEKSAVESLKGSGFIPLQVAVKKDRFRQSLRRRPKGDILAFTTELSVLLSAGLPLDRSLHILSDIAESQGMREVIQSVLKSIREGHSFSDSLQHHPRLFPRLYINMVRAGESSGVLATVLEKLTDFLESSKELKDHIVSAMIYPAILVITGGVSVLVLLTFVLPKFAVIFDEFGGRLPLPTKIVMSFSNTLQSMWWVGLIVIVAAAIFIKQYLQTEKGRYNWDALKLKLLKDIIRKMETARFCRTLGTLLKSGVPHLQALRNATDVIGNQVIASALSVLAKGAKEGKGIAGPISDTGMFPPLALSMIKVGEETGQLDEMLLKVATTYEKNLKETVRRFVSLLEPLMILIMGLLIGFIVISMLMAIFSITDLPM